MKNIWKVNDLKCEYYKFCHITYRGAGALLTFTILNMIWPYFPLNYNALTLNNFDRVLVKKPRIYVC